MAKQIFRPPHQLPRPPAPRSYQWWLIIAIFLTLGVTYFIMSQFIGVEGLKTLPQVQVRYLGLALVASGIGIWIDGIRLLTMTRITGDHLTQMQATRTVLGNYFFSFFTPGSSGGPIAQFLLLQRYGISSGKAALFIITRTLASLVVMLLIFPLVFYTEAEHFKDLPVYFPLLLVGLLLGAIGLGLRLAQSKTFVKWTRDFLFRYSPQKFRRKLLRAHQDLFKITLLFSQHPSAMVTLLGQTFASLVISYSMVYFLFKALSSNVPYLLLMGRMFVMNFLMHFSPTPGGSGVAEGLFLFFFVPQSSQSLAGIVALLWRICAEYLPALAGLVIMIHEFGYPYLKKNFMKEKEE